MKNPPPQARKIRRIVRLACAWACAAALGAAATRNQAVAATALSEPPIIPTVHPTLTPTSAINLPLDLHGDSITVWKNGSDQRILLSGNATAVLGYRKLSANTAAITLTPTREGGENTFDVAVFLSGDVKVQEGLRADAPVTTANELLVTTRITNVADLTGGMPVAKVMEDNAIVKRGDVLRNDLLNSPPPQIYLPNIVITEAEEALQNGWIARGVGNRIIAGPAETALARGPGGTGTGGAGLPGESVGSGTGPAAPPKTKPKPRVFATADSVKGIRQGDEQLVIMSGGFYLMFNDRPDRSPFEFRAQRAVVFGVADQATTAPASQPARASGPAPAPAPGPARGRGARAGRGAPTPNEPTDLSGLAKNVSGVYLEGDVTIEVGERTLRAERIYFDFTSMRAILLDATVSAVDETRNVPVYMRATEIRMLSRREFVAKDATFSTSEFHTPHYHIGASDAYLQDITPRDSAGRATGPAVYGFDAKDATMNIQGVPVFWWPYLSGDTSRSPIPLREAKVGYNDTYGMTLQTDWDLFGLLGQREPQGVHTDLHLDYFGKRGPAGGLDARWLFDDSTGLLKSYVLQDSGTDKLARNRDDLVPQNDTRGRITAREKLTLDPNWTLSLEGTYISDPNFLEQFFPAEFEEGKENETVAYLKYANKTEALTFLGKWTLYDFTSNADLVNDQFTTEKAPEIKYWRIGDSLFDVFTYYSETGVANMRQSFTNFTPSVSGLQSLFPAIGPNQTFKDFYLSHGYTDQSVLRADTRQELDLPLNIGDMKITPYVSGRLTAWDQQFPEPDSGGNTVRAWGQAGMRGSMEFWRVYDDVESQFWDVHRIRHVIEPEFIVFETGSNKDRGDIQPFDRDVEDISNASGAALTLHQKWQTKRGGEGHWRNVDWITLDVQAAGVWNKQENVGNFFAGDPLRGYLFTSRPELSLVHNSINADFTWRVGEWTRYMAEGNYNLDENRVEQFAQGIAIDHSPYLSYFIGNRYIAALGTDEWTFGFSYDITRKYTLSMEQSYDFNLAQNILTSMTVVRRMPRFNFGVTLAYDANLDDTTFVVTMWPEGVPEMGFGNRGLIRTPVTHESE